MTKIMQLFSIDSVQILRDPKYWSILQPGSNLKQQKSQ